MVTGVVSVIVSETEVGRSRHLSRFAGCVGAASLTYSVLEVGPPRSARGARGVEYLVRCRRKRTMSSNRLTLGYTHRLFGEVDAQVTGQMRRSTTATPSTCRRIPTRSIRSAGASGIICETGLAFALNYEYARRRSPAVADRNYERRRAFLSWQFAF